MISENISCRNFTMASDQLSAWLTNLELLNQLTDATLLSKRDEIVSFFGGFRKMIALCLRDQNTLDLLQQRQLFPLFDSFKNKQIEKSNQLQAKSEDVDSDTTLAATEPNQTAPFLNMHDIAISVIFTHLNQRDHFSLQLLCRRLTIIGRNRASYRISPNNLKVEHQLANIMDKLQSDDKQKVKRGVQDLVVRLRDADNTKIIRAGILPLLFRLCVSGDSPPKPHQISLMKFFARDNMLLLACNTQLAMRYGTIAFCKQMLTKGACVGDAVSIIGAMYHSCKSNAVALNRAGIFPLIVRHLSVELEKHQLDSIFMLLESLLCSPSFDSHLSDNQKALQTLCCPHFHNLWSFSPLAVPGDSTLRMAFRDLSTSIRS